jgi:DNA-binding response OmpR family regulator
MDSILVVDDQKMLLSVLRRVLRARYPETEVHTFATVAEASAFAERERPSLVVTDLRLGDGNGLEMIERLEARWGPGLPILMISAVLEPDVRERLEELGHRYLKKPFRNREFFRVIDEIRAEI